MYCLVSIKKERKRFVMSGSLSDCVHLQEEKYVEHKQKAVTESYEINVEPYRSFQRFPKIDFSTSISNVHFTGIGDSAHNHHVVSRPIDATEVYIEKSSKHLLLFRSEKTFPSCKRREVEENC